MAVYVFTSGTTWTIPSGVTSIQVECFAAQNALADSGTNTGSIGPSYAKSNSIAVTPGNTLRILIPAPVNGGSSDVWATTVATGTPVVGVTYTTSNSCLAKGSQSATPLVQTTASIGDVKYGGGAGGASGSSGAGGAGGAAGPNGAGAQNGTYGTTPLYGAGGGANGGSAATSTTPPYGRGGSSNSQGWGGYYNGTSFVEPTQDVLGTSNYLNNVASVVNYGPYGGGYGYTYRCDCCTIRAYKGNAGFIVITTTGGGAPSTGGKFLPFFQ
jgi:hypothetical protein